MADPKEVLEHLEGLEQCDDVMGYKVKAVVKMHVEFGLEMDDAISYGGLPSRDMCSSMIESAMQKLG